MLFVKIMLIIITITITGILIQVNANKNDIHKISNTEIPAKEFKTVTLHES